jgi:hypothetical protein
MSMIGTGAPVKCASRLSHLIDHMSADTSLIVLVADLMTRRTALLCVDAVTLRSLDTTIAMSTNCGGTVIV